MGKEAAPSEKSSVSSPIVNIIAVIICVILGGLMALAGSNGWSGSLTQSLSPLPVFAFCIIINFLIQWVAFIVAFCLHTEKFYDIIGSITYWTVALVGFAVTIPAKPVLFEGVALLVMVLLWSLRLGLFLVYRAFQHGDSRFYEAKYDFFEFLKYWTLQALWITFTVGAALAGMCGRQAESTPLTLSLSIIGIVIWLFGFVFEVVSDFQKSIFKRDPANRGRFINTGLWSISRHPNYFGEIVLWVGVAIAAGPLLEEFQFFTLISPIFVFVLIRFGSGVPILEKTALERWGNDPEFQHYIQTVPVLWPCCVCCV